jgi:hypothetical protein
MQALFEGDLSNSNESDDGEVFWEQITMIQQKGVRISDVSLKGLPDLSLR